MNKCKEVNINIVSITSNEYGVYGIGDDLKIYHWINKNGGYWEKFWSDQS